MTGPIDDSAPAPFADLPSRHGLIPQYGGTSAWIDHFPFAYDFFQTLRPPCVVEVGGGQIDAFLSFGQITRALAFACQRTLIVDEQAGPVGRRLAETARALEGDAVVIAGPGERTPNLADDSIDLLELDGEILGALSPSAWARWVGRVRPGGWIWLHGCAPNPNGNRAVAEFFHRVRAEAADWFLFHHGAGLGTWRKPGGEPLTAAWLATLAAARDQTIDLARHYEHAGRLARAWMPASRAVRKGLEIPRELGGGELPLATPSAAATAVPGPENHQLLYRAMDAHRQREEEVRSDLQAEQAESGRLRRSEKSARRQWQSAILRALRAEARIKALESDLAAERGRARSMSRSLSWRVTLPLRWAAEKFGPKAPTRPTASAPGFPVSGLQPSALPTVRYQFDLPQRWHNLVPGKQLVHGWCFAPGGPPMTEVRASSGRRSFVGRFLHPRHDVAKVWQLENPAEPCGFDVEIMIPPGHSEWIFEYRFPGETLWQEFDRRWLRALPSHYSRLSRRGRLDGQAQASGTDAYTRYLRRFDRLDDDAREHLARRVLALHEPPLISVIMPAWESPVRYLQLAIDSVRRQIYPHWELCIADDASVSAQARLALEDAAKSDARIRLDLRATRGHISESSNAAIALARGSWLALLDHDDELHPAALAALALEIQRHPEAGLIYTDEDKIDLAGRRFGPYFKPDWNPDLLLGQNCISHLGCYRAALVRELGGFRRGVEGCQDWDLALRATDRLRGDQIRHIPRVLYHWRTVPGSTASTSTDKSYIYSAGRRVLEEHFERVGVSGVELRPVPGWQWEVRFPLPEPAPRVSILIPTRDHVALARRCVESVLGKTDYPDFELVVIDNESREPATLAWLAELGADPRVRVLRYEQPFNYAAMHNWAVPQTSGQVLCLLNNDLSDLECITPGWLRDMTALALRPQTGAVGALLLYPDDTVQHAGVVLGIDGCAGHAFRRARRGTDGQMGRLRILQNYSAVTGACLVVRRALWDEVGGMDAEQLGVAFNDVDFCLKLQARGYRNTWTPTAEFTHHESSSRGFEDTPEKLERFRRERAIFIARWAAELAADPAYNPNLSFATESFDLALEPRIKPWREY